MTQRVTDSVKGSDYTVRGMQEMIEHCMPQGVCTITGPVYRTGRPLTGKHLAEYFEGVEDGKAILRNAILETCGEDYVDYMERRIANFPHKAVAVGA